MRRGTEAPPLARWRFPSDRPLCRPGNRPTISGMVLLFRNSTASAGREWAGNTGAELFEFHDLSPVGRWTFPGGPFLWLRHSRKAAGECSGRGLRMRAGR